VLQSNDWTDFMANMYGNQPDRWQDELSGYERLRVIVNALTRLRFCTPQARWNLHTTEMPRKHHRAMSRGSMCRADKHNKPPLPLGIGRHSHPCKETM